MARRAGGSAAGYGLLLVVGGLVWLVNGVYEFVRQNMPLIVAVLAFAAAFGLLLLVVRAARRGRSERASASPILSAASPGKSDIGPLPAAKWVRPGEAVQVQDTTISSGLFYCGGALRLPDGRAVQQYAINPKLPASRGQGDVTGASMPYWPSYASMTPQARRAFLNWMAGGRKDPSCGIGHVFIFFYGIEHRLFVEGRAEDARALATEVRRLFSIYGSNNSFRGYAEKFLSCAALLAGAARAPPSLTPDIGTEAEIPLAVRLHLGAKLAASDRLGAGDALLWLSVPSAIPSEDGSCPLL